MNERRLEEIRCAVNETPCPQSSIEAARLGDYGDEYWMHNGQEIARELLAEIDRRDESKEARLCAADDENLNYY